MLPGPAGGEKVGTARTQEEGAWPRPSYLSHRPLGVTPKTGQELAPAFAAMANRLLWRHRARPSATLDKMRTEL